jgi:hypothetical protein
MSESRTTMKRTTMSRKVGLRDDGIQRTSRW